MWRAVMLCCLFLLGGAHAQRVSEPGTGRHPNWKAFVALTAATGAATVADIGLSRRCVQLYRGCREANPLLPRNAAGTWAFEAGVSTVMAMLAYQLRQHHHRWWAMPLLALVGAHTLGAASAWHTLHALGAHP